MKKRILFNGCSFTANCGFDIENQKLYHWPWLLSQHYDWYFTNVAIGGSSNDEIFYRTIENYHFGKYDLYVIMWSSLGRHWIYHSQNNIDNFTIVNGGEPAGFNHDHKEVKDYAKLHYAFFDNNFVNLKKWLLQIKCLHDFFSANKQKYVFLKGFDNLLNDLMQSIYVPGQGFHMSTELKNILNFDNLPDYYINLKLQTLKSLLADIDQSTWLNFDTKSFRDGRCDYADDNRHPGIKSNHDFAQKFINYFDNIELLNL